MFPDFLCAGEPHVTSFVCYQRTFSLNLDVTAPDRHAHSGRMVQLDRARCSYVRDWCQPAKDNRMFSVAILPFPANEPFDRKLLRTAQAAKIPSKPPSPHSTSLQPASLLPGFWDGGDFGPDQARLLGSRPALDQKHRGLPICSVSLTASPSSDSSVVRR